MPLPRKVLIRIIGAPILLALLGGILYVDYPRGGDPHAYASPGLWWLLAVVGTLSAVEFYGMCRAKGVETADRAGLVAVAILLVPWGWVLRTLDLPGLHAHAQFLRSNVRTFLILYVLLKLVFRNGRFTPEGAAFTLMGFFYVGLLDHQGRAPVADPRAAWWYLIFLVAANKGSDMAAFVVGKTMGRRKMTPVLSPHKTWEGAAGGMVGGVGAAMAVLLATPLREGFARVPVPALLCLAILVTMAAQVGDLVESAFKRWAGVKDSGRLVPEFGGILDMVDSFLISIPVAHLASQIVIDTYRQTPGGP